MNILLVSWGVPLPGEAGSPRTYRLAESIAEQHMISLVLVDANPIDGNNTSRYLFKDSPFCAVADLRVGYGTGSRARRLLNALCGHPWFATRLIRRREHFAAMDAVQRLCEGVDVVWVDGLFVLQYAEGCGVPMVVDEIDYMSRLAFAHARTRSSVAGRLLGLWRARLIRRYERTHLGNAHAVTLISDIDAAHMLCEIKVPTEVVMNGCDTAFFRPPATKPSLPGTPAILFVGNYSYQPNHDAAQYIFEELSESILSVFPSAKIYLVGPPPEGGFEGAPSSVEVLGFVDDVRDYYAGADVFMSPLRIGTGIKNKVLEAAAMQCAIVATDISIEGIDFEDGVHFLRANTPVEFVEKITAALEGGGAFGRSLGASARQAVETKYNWAAEARKMEILLLDATRKEHVARKRKERR